MNTTEYSPNELQHRYHVEYAALVGPHPRLEESDEESSLHPTTTESIVSYSSCGHSSLADAHSTPLDFDPEESRSIPVAVEPGPKLEHNSVACKSKSTQGHHRRHASAPKSLYHRFRNLPSSLTDCLHHKSCPPQTRLTDSQSSYPVVAASDLGATEEGRFLGINKLFPVIIGAPMSSNSSGAALTAEAYGGLGDNKGDDWNEPSSQKTKHRRNQSAPVIIHDDKMPRHTFDPNSVINLPGHGISYSRSPARTGYYSAIETSWHRYDPAKPLPVSPRWPFPGSNRQAITNDEQLHAFPASLLLDSGQVIMNCYRQREHAIGLTDAPDDGMSNMRIGFVENAKLVIDSTVHGTRRASMTASLCSD
jgi:hypothetical protein